MSEFNRRRHDRGGIAAETSVGHEGTVDLEFIHRQQTELRERGVPGAEIVDREAHAGDPEQLHVSGRELRIAHYRALGDFQHQGGRFDPMSTQCLQDFIAQVRIEDIRGGQVHRKFDRNAAA